MVIALYEIYDYNYIVQKTENHRLCWLEYAQQVVHDSTLIKIFYVALV